MGSIQKTGKLIDVLLSGIFCCCYKAACGVSVERQMFYRSEYWLKINIKQLTLHTNIAGFKTTIQMKKLVYTCLLLLVVYATKAQDLVVTATGDSVNCTITQEAEGYLYLTVKHNGGNRNIKIEKSKIAGYQKGFYGAPNTPKQEPAKHETANFVYRGEVKEAVPMPTQPKAEVDNSFFRIHAYGNYVNSGLNVPAWNAGVSAGFAINRHWEWGVGFDYSSNTLDYAIVDEYGNMILPEISTSSLLGYTYLSYYQHIVHRLFFTPKFTLGYGSVETDYYTSQNVSLIGLELAPRLTFFANKHVGFSVSLGGLQLVIPNEEWDNRQLIASFNPSYWQWGMVIAF